MILLYKGNFAFGPPSTAIPEKQKPHGDCHGAFAVLKGPETVGSFRCMNSVILDSAASLM
jgi:hypothetical protein